MRRRRGLAAAVLLAVLGALLAWAILPSLYSARPLPPAIETAVATWLLHASVPPGLAKRADPLPPSEFEIGAGAVLFQRNCATCHAWDGSGQT